MQHARGQRPRMHPHNPVKPDTSGDTNMKKRLLSLLLAAMMLIACAGALAETAVFTDDLGREVTLPTEISRLVVSGAIPQIYVYGIAPDLFVGIADKWYTAAEGIIPEDRLSLPYFGKLYGSADLSIEQLALADPQVIIDMGEPKKGIEEDLNGLTAQTAIPAVYIKSTLETAPQAYRRLGELLGRQAQGEEIAAFLERVYSRTLAIMEKVGGNRRQILYITGDEGHNVLAKGSYQAELIDMLADNLAVVDNPVSKGTGNEVTMEQIMLWDPEFLVFAPDSVYDSVKDDSTWSLMTAVAGGDYIRTPQGPHNWLGSPPAVQQYLGLIWLTAELYPEYCDYDVKGDILEFYRLIYHCELTDAQYDALTAGAFLNK